MVVELVNQDFKLSLLLCLIFVLIFNLFVTPEFVNRGDYNFHYENSAGISNRAYATLPHVIGSFFAFNKQAFMFYVVLLVGFITPLALWHITRTWQTVLFFYASQYFWFMLQTISQALAGIFFVGIIATKNNYLRFLFLILGAVSHGQGAMLLTFTWIVMLVFESSKTKNFLLACGSLLGDVTPDIVKSHLAGHETFGVSVGTVLNFFWKIMPFSFLFFGLKQLWREKYFAPIVLILMAVVGSVLKMDRTLYLIPLIVLPYSGKYCNNSSKKLRYGFYFLAFALIFLQVFSWIKVKTACV